MVRTFFCSCEFLRYPATLLITLFGYSKKRFNFGKKECKYQNHIRNES